MALFRCLVPAMLVVALAAGCSQSLFDGGPGGDNGNGNGDAAPGVVDASRPPPDGNTMPPTDGGQVIEPDAGGVQPDASPPRPVCPEPCAGDAYGDFANMQGGRNGDWYYVELQPEKPDSPYVEMTFSVIPGPSVGWIGSGVAPIIGLCNSPTSIGPCVEMDDVLALASPGNTADAHQPGLMWIVPEDGRYAVSGTWRVSSAAPEAPTTMKLTRNSHSDVLRDDAPVLTTAPYEFNFPIEVVAGDRIVLTATATTSQGVVVGVDLFVSGPLAP